MMPRVRTGLFGAAVLLLGVLATASLPAVSAAASGQVCVGVVVDDGSGGSPAPQSAQVAPGTSDLQALSAAGDSATQNASGLVCAVNGYPANGLQNCTAVSGGQYYYWSYWQGDPSSNTWTYAQAGPASHTVGAGQTYVEGWRYQNPGPDNASAPKPAITPAAAFAAACPGVTPVSPAGGGGGTPGPAPSGAGSTSGSAGSPPGSSSVTGAAPAVPPATGAATSPAAATGGGRSAPGGGGGGGTTTTSPAAAGSAAGQATAAGAAHPGDAGSTTTTPRGRGGLRVKGHASAALASSTPHGGSGGSPFLPLVLVAAAIVVIGGLTLSRWRRRPSEE